MARRSSRPLSAPISSTTRSAPARYVGLALIAPAGFAFGWVVYALLMQPLVRRSKGGAALEIDSILATFGLLFVIQGVMLVAIRRQLHQLQLHEFRRRHPGRKRRREPPACAGAGGCDRRRPLPASHPHPVGHGAQGRLGGPRVRPAGRHRRGSSGALRLRARRRARGLRRGGHLDVPDLHRLVRRDFHHEGVDRGHHGRRGEPRRRAQRRADPRPGRDFRRHLCQPGPDACRRLSDLPGDPAVASRRPFRKGRGDEDEPRPCNRGDRLRGACMRAVLSRRLRRRPDDRPDRQRHAGLGLGAVLRPHGLRLAGHRRLLRHRRLRRRRAQRDAALSCSSCWSRARSASSWRWSSGFRRCGSQASISSSSPSGSRN